jgi:hypothetical protein
MVTHFSDTAPCLQQSTTLGRSPGNRHYSYFCPSVELWLLAQAQTISPGAGRHRALLNRPRPHLHRIRYSFPLHSSVLFRKCCCILPGHRDVSACSADSPVPSSLSSSGASEVVLMVFCYFRLAVLVTSNVFLLLVRLTLEFREYSFLKSDTDCFAVGTSLKSNYVCNTGYQQYHNKAQTTPLNQTREKLHTIAVVYPALCRWVSSSGI